jgi:hypothetical protein
MGEKELEAALWNTLSVLTFVGASILEIVAILAPYLEPEIAGGEVGTIGAEQDQVAELDAEELALVENLTPYQKGELAKLWSVEAAISRGEQIAGQEVDLTFTINGKPVSVRADVLIKTGPNDYVYIESKFSPKASYTPNQKIVIPALVQAGDDGLVATVGARSGTLVPGTQINVTFQGDVWTASPNLMGGGG